MRDLKYLIRIGPGRAVKDVEQPFRRRKAGAVRGDDALPALQEQQRGTRNRIKRFDAAVREDGQLAESRQVPGAGVVRCAQRESHGESGGETDQRGKVPAPSGCGRTDR